jgi:hypothetical protein
VETPVKEIDSMATKDRSKKPVRKLKSSGKGKPPKSNTKTDVRSVASRDASSRDLADACRELKEIASALQGLIADLREFLADLRQLVPSLPIKGVVINPPSQIQFGQPLFITIQFQNLFDLFLFLSAKVVFDLPGFQEATYQPSLNAILNVNTLTVSFSVNTFAPTPLGQPGPFLPDGPEFPPDLIGTGTGTVIHTTILGTQFQATPKLSLTPIQPTQ